jgi:hypothetical protein
MFSDPECFGDEHVASRRSFVMREERRALPKVIGLLETLDDRLLLSAAIVTTTVLRSDATADMTHARLLSSAAVRVPMTTPTTSASDVQNGPFAKAGQQLATLYDAFAKDGSVDPTLSHVLVISGKNVGINVVSTPGQFPALVSELTTLGMQIQASSANYDLVSGLVPIGQLLTVAQLPQTLSMSPIHIRRLSM